jgi:hypothetical protein
VAVDPRRAAVSVQALSCAFALRGLGASEKLVLLALANYADASMCCWPSQDRLADDTELSARTVWSALKGLEEKCIVSRRQRKRADGTRSTDVFTLHFDQVAKAASGGNDHSQIPQKQVATVATLTTFEPSKNHQRESSLRSDSRPPAPPEPELDDELEPAAAAAVVDAEFEDVGSAQLALIVAEPDADRLTRAEVLRLWNETAERCNLAFVKEITEARWRAVKARTGRHGISAWRDLLAKVEASAFLQGRVGGRGWKCDFDWVLKPANWQKIIEDGYDDRHRNGGRDAGTGADQPQPDRRLQQMGQGAALALARIQRRQGGG